MAHWLQINGKIVALVTCDCYGKRKEIGCADLLGMYSPDQICSMRTTLRTVGNREQSKILLAMGG